MAVSRGRIVRKLLDSIPFQGFVAIVLGVSLSAFAPGVDLYIFLIVLIAALLEVSGLILTLLFPRLQIWPPPGRRSWQYWFIGVGWTIIPPGAILIGILDWGTSWFVHWSRFIAGGLLAAFGYFFIKWSSRLLDRGDQSQSLGLEGPLHTEGPYLYTRNPQYIGFTLFLTGIVLITNSFMALAIGILAILWLFLAPFSEEPWLHEQFGKEYEEYRKRVPRWIGKASFKRRTSSVRRPR